MNLPDCVVNSCFLSMKAEISAIELNKYEINSNEFQVNFVVLGSIRDDWCSWFVERMYNVRYTMCVVVQYHTWSWSFGRTLSLSLLCIRFLFWYWLCDLLLMQIEMINDYDDQCHVFDVFLCDAKWWLWTFNALRCSVAHCCVFGFPLKWIVERTEVSA